MQKSENWQPATLIVATIFGITILVEGGFRITEDLYGYGIKHILYEKIASIELDFCFLSGKLIISSSLNSENETAAEFNTAKYYLEFERMIQVIRKILFNLKRT
jgi:hypothetical protein